MLELRSTILIPTANRNHLLEWSLKSIRGYYNGDIIVLNDYLPDASEQLATKYGTRYIYTGSRNISGIKYRDQGFALNIGSKHTDADILVLTCAEMYHVNDCMTHLLLPFEHDTKFITTAKIKYDLRGRILKALDTNDILQLDREQDMKRYLPFLVAVDHATFNDINGYDEDMDGQAFTDNDIVDRLQGAGCYFVDTPALAIHLYHTRNMAGRNKEAWDKNKRLYDARKGTTIRNTDREWGQL